MIDFLLGLDRKIFLVMNSWNAHWLNPVMVFFSNQLIWAPFLALMIWYAYKHLEKRPFFLFLFFLLITIGASDATSSSIIKNIFQRYRPCRLEDLKPLINNFGQRCGGKYGFVSSHAANAFAIVWFFLMGLKIKPSIFYALFALPILVSFSRIYLGVHYPGDVLAGTVIGLSWATAMAYFFNHRQKRLEA